MNTHSGFARQVSVDIIRDAQTSDKHALEMIYREFAQPCYALAMRMTGDQQASQDIVHNVFIRVIQRIDSVRDYQAFSGWLKQIAVNESLTYLRKHCALEALLETTETTLAQIETNLDQYLSSAWWEAFNDLAKMTQALPADARVVLFLHELEGYSHKEIAALLNRSESFSKQVLARTLRQLSKTHIVEEKQYAQ